MINVLQISQNSNLTIFELPWFISCRVQVPIIEPRSVKNILPKYNDEIAQGLCAFLTPFTYCTIFNVFLTPPVVQLLSGTWGTPIIWEAW